MQSKVGPKQIAAAVVVLLLVLFVIYHFTFGSKSNQPAITPDNRPDYVKQLEAGGRPSWPASGPQAGAPTSTK